MKEFNFHKAFSFKPAAVLKINLATSIFQGFCPAFKKVFLEEYLSLAASISPLKRASYSQPEMIY